MKITAVPKRAPDHFIYKLVVIRQLQGNVSPTINLYEGNDSGRAPFDWKLHKEYLLFLETGLHDHWVIDSCGNSAPIEEAGSLLKEIQSDFSSRQDGVIAGMIGTDSWTTGVSGVDVKISGEHSMFKLNTDTNGRFSQTVPVGNYTVTANRNGEDIPAEPFSYENPAHIVIRRGGCAQVQFTDSK